ncbi:MAG: beta-ketoacyl-ACP synthase II [Candidatus Aegiribacteria sp.]|nr:beta-ketoacyl-ACP synthase II [Candidatus Aegiribacteria sp.]
MEKRVVITGAGIIGPVGNTASENWKAALAGRSGIRRMTIVDPEQFTSQIAGEVKDFDPLDYFERKLAKRIDRYTQFAMIAAREAYENSNIINSIEPERLGVIIGSGIGGITTLEREHKIALERGVNRMSPFFCPMMISNIAAGRIGIDVGAKGLNFATVTACASSGHAIAIAADMIKLGRVDAILAGGSEAPLTLTGVGGFCQLKALSTRNDDPKTASRPFDRDRDGFVLAEGGAVVMIEDMEHALNRGVDIIAEISGSGMTCDAFHITAPAENGEGSARAMKIAIEEAGIKPSEVDYINAHGTSTPLNDINESKAIETVFNSENATKIPVSSTKSVTGHMLGAAGAVEAIFTAFALRDGILPPTATLQNPGEGCNLDYVPKEARKADIMYALSNSLGFGGHNVTLALKKYSGE